MKYLSSLSLFLIFFTAKIFAADVLVSTLEDSPDPAPRGGEINYAITVGNNAADAAADVELTFPLPATTSFVSVDNGSCTHDGGAPGSVNCDFGNLAGLAEIDLNIIIKTSETTPASIAVEATATTSSTDTNALNDRSTQNTTIEDGADLNLTMSDSIDPVTAGGEFSYTLIVNNAGPNDSGALKVENTLPTGVNYLSANGGGWSCSNSGQVVTCTRSALANNSNAPAITINTKVVGAISGTVTNSAIVSATGIVKDPNTNNNTQTENTTINPGTDLSITKTVDAPVIANTNATFTLKPRNNGPYLANTVEVIDTLPADFIMVSATGAGWVCNTDGANPETITCGRSTYAVGATDNIQIQTSVPATGVNVVNSVAISTTDTDSIASNNTDSVTFDIVPDGADLEISKTKGPNPVALGSNMTSSIRVKNNGPKATSGIVTVIDTLHDDEEYVSFSGTNWSCNSDNASPEVVTCEFSNQLSNGASSDYLYIVTKANAAGTLTNNACAHDIGGEPDSVIPNHCTGAGVESTTDTADLSIVKAVSTVGGTVNVLETNENQVTYTLTVTHVAGDILNGNDNDAVVVTDDIPAYLTNVIGATPSNTGIAVSDDHNKFDCATTGGVVRCELKNGETMSQGDVSIFTIIVDRPLDDGSFTNTAEVDSAVLGDPNQTNNSDSVALTVNPIADVEMVSLGLTPSTAEAGTDVTKVLTFRNNGPSAAEDVEVTHTFNPNGHFYDLISATTTQGNCAALVGNVLTCTIGTLTRNESHSITLKVRPRWESGNPEWVLTNTSAITTTTIESDLSNNSKSEDLSVVSSELDLLINTTDIEDPISWNPSFGAFPATTDNIVRYKMEITNRGPSVATDVYFDAVLEPQAGKQFTFLCDGITDASGGSCTSADVICSNVGNSVIGANTMTMRCELPSGTELEVNDTYTRYLFFRADTAPDPTGDTLSITPTVASNEFDTYTPNNSEGESTSLRIALDLAVDITPSKTSVTIYEPFNWTMIVTNNGPGNSANSELTNNLPAGMELTGPPVPSQGVCTGINTETSFDCDFGTINNGNVASVQLPVRFITYPTGGTSSNTATITTAGFDSDSSNNSDTEIVTVTQSSIAGQIYIDLNDDGIVAGNEDGIAGVTLNLSGIDLYGNSVNITKTTDIDGQYLFDELIPSNASGYSITEIQPADFDDGLENANGSLVTNSRATDTINAIVLVADTNLENYNFGELGRASIRGSVWHDENNNGVKDGAETTGIANVTVTLSGTLSIITQTDINGNYEFDNLIAGTYVVTETHPVVWTDGSEQLGNAGGNIANDVFSNIILTAAQQGSGYNFGEQSAKVSGKVYRDTNDDGVVDIGEVGIAGVRLTLTGKDGNGIVINQTTVTDANGDYLFLVAASDGTGYSIRETQPSKVIDGKDTVGTLGGTLANDLISGIVVAANSVGTGYNFGEGADIPDVTLLQGVVFIDANDDGQFNAGEQGIAGVELQLSGETSTGQTVNLTQLTNSQGEYSFDNLSASNAMGYQVTEKQPTDFDDGLDSIGGSIIPNSRNSDSLTGLVVLANKALINNNFGELYKGRLSGFVFVDNNKNGLKDNNESGIANVEMVLTGISQNGKQINLTQLTDANGQYLFTQLPPSNSAGYTLTETHPVDYLDGQESIAGVIIANSEVSDTISGIQITLNSELKHYDFAEWAIGSISGVVFIDANADGVYLPTSKDEAGIANVRLTLTGTDNSGALVQRHTTTDINGQYLFDLLQPSDANGYQINEVQPVNYDDGLDSIAGVVLANSQGSDSLTGLVLKDQEALINNNFGELYKGRLSGFVFVDNNKNGLKDNNENGIANVEMVLAGISQNGKQINLTQLTDANGQYLFTQLPPSNSAGYTLTETHPVDYLDGQESIAGVIIANSAVSDTISGIQITLNSELKHYDFAEWAIGSISGVVFIDANADGLYSNDETGIENVSLTLTGTDHLGAAVTRTITTDKNGQYLFDLLDPSDTNGYQISEVQPAEYLDGAESIGQQIIADSYKTDKIIDVQLPANTQLENYNFAELEGASLHGEVWVDENDNGERDESETLSIEGVTITLTGIESWKEDATVQYTQITDINGQYNFSGLRAGNYVISQTQPTAWHDGQDHLGSLDGILANDQFSKVVIAAGENGIDYNFGERGSSLSGRVFNDQNRDGIRTENEPGIPNVTITLAGTDINGQSVERSVLTGVDGKYMFSHLPLPNSQGYLVTETQPSEMDDGLDSLGSHGGELSNDSFSKIIFTDHISHLIDYDFGELLKNPSSISGLVWLDSNHNRDEDEGNGLEGWTVQLIDTRDNPKNNEDITPIAVVKTDINGRYLFEGLSPGIYEVRFIHEQNGAIYGYGVSDEPGVDLSFGTIRNITLDVGEDIEDQNLPIDPSGVVYDSKTREPVAGATVRFEGPVGFDPERDLVGGLANVEQITGNDGVYQFLIFNSAPKGVYTLVVTEPNGYLPGVSKVLQVCTNTVDILASPTPALVQRQDSPPPLSASVQDPENCGTTSADFSDGDEGTQYYLSFNIDPLLPSGNVINNHIPVDPIDDEMLSVIKTTNVKNASRGDFVPYSIVVTNNQEFSLSQLNVIDQLPPGFKYVVGSATINGMKVEPLINDRQLIWSDLNFAANQQYEIDLITIIGAGVGEGEYVNQAWGGYQNSQLILTNIADATVRIVPDPLFDCSDVSGKVFNDLNANGYQDADESGLPAVRLATARGLLVTTDEHGRYHIACAGVPNEMRGSNFIIKIDERTLPSGFRVTTENPRVVRLTRGKMVKANFGATIHRVVRIQVNADAFEGDNLNDKSQQQLQTAMKAMRLQPSVLRLAYGQRDEDIDVIERRLELLRENSEKLWQECECKYELIFEQEIYQDERSMKDVVNARGAGNE
ncbi:SdrD B-like domain-containing protein [Thalassotalea profundi]|uniref:DUF11 domain-containing protein n=1 Tax=Thalassotalea profundi TaxID=2036687 RepID=A0ABQ3INF0_9GAMM|nr:SdrD B-like domain-containing protein [Thalassotalea profundi]GHE88911.1 hypothetical protein GCM10011501_17930 [Thalassotalea profundi]